MPAIAQQKSDLRRRRAASSREREEAMKNDALHSAITLLLQIIDEAYDRRTWHGPNLKGSLRGVTAKDAVWRPAPGRHNIREVVLHAAYWKYVVRRKLRGEARGSFAIRGSNWFGCPESLTEEEWRHERALLNQEHRRLREAVVGLLHARARKIPTSMIFGVAFHDVYHAGQIRLLRRLRAKAKRG